MFGCAYVRYINILFYIHLCDFHLDRTQFTSEMPLLLMIQVITFTRQTYTKLIARHVIVVIIL